MAKRTHPSRKRKGAELSEEMRWPQNRRKVLLALNREAMGYYHRMLMRSSRALEYLGTRGFEGVDRVATRYQIGYAPTRDEGVGFVPYILKRGVFGVSGQEELERALVASGLAKRLKNGRLVDFFYGRMTFPVAERGSLDLLTDPNAAIVGFGGRYVPRPDKEKGDSQPPKWLNTPETTVFTKRSLLYGYSWGAAEIAAERKVVLLEGYLDVIQAREAGFEYVAASLGTSLTKQHIKLFPSSTKRKTLRVYISTDDDEAGRRSAWRSSRLLFLHRPDAEVRIARPIDGLDPDDLILKHGPEGFQSVLDQAVTPLVRHLLDVKEAGIAARLKGVTDALRDAPGLLGSSLKDRRDDIAFLHQWLKEQYKIHIPVNKLAAILEERAERGETTDE